MQKKAVLFSAGEYLDSRAFPKPDLDLPGVKHDITAVEKRLTQIGFDVVKRENVSRPEYFQALEKGLEKCPRDAVFIVYFSGHGGHYNGKNYIFPSDFAVRFEASKNIDDASIDIEEIVSLFRGKCRLILILDACRSDLGLSKGYYSEMIAAEDVYIAYGAMLRQGAVSVNSGMSWFTEAICDEILAPNIDVDNMFMRVRQNIFTKHYMQIPASINLLLDSIVLNSETGYDDIDKQVFDFVERFGNEYNDKYGYFHGDDLVFIDAAQYFGIGLLDAIWKYRKVDNSRARDKGIKVPDLTEVEEKIVAFLGFTRGKKHFTYDESHTWYYNGRQIRMGEIPPLPPSMQRKLPESGKELYVCINAKKENGEILIKTNLPNRCEIFVWDNITKLNRKMIISDGKVVIHDAGMIGRIVIDSGVFSLEKELRQIIGEKCRNLIGDVVKYHPIFGNQIAYALDF